MSEQAAPDSTISRFLSEKQDPVAVAKVLEKVKQILTSSEEVVYIAVQKGLVNIAPDSVILTNRRFIIYSPTIVGGASFKDYAWRDLMDVTISEGMLTSTLRFKLVTGGVFHLIEKLPKEQARKLYSYAQEMEEKVREERRQRDMEEKRAMAGGGIVVNASPQPAQVAAPAAQEDPMAKIKKLKDMLEAGLISQQEFDDKKNDIIAKM